MGEPHRCADGLRVAPRIGLQVCVVKAELSHTDVFSERCWVSAEPDPQRPQVI